MNWIDTIKSIAPTVATALYRHGLLWCLSGVYSIRNCISVYPSLFTPLRKSFRNPIAGYMPVLSCIVTLFFCGSPSAVFGSVVAVDINPIESHFFRLNTHVCKESIECQPLIADGYTSTTVLRPLDLLWIGASLEHRPPSKVSGCTRHSMSDVRYQPRFCLPASAGFGVTRTQEIGAYYGLLSTIANAFPSGFSVDEIRASDLAYCYESSESLPRNVSGAIVDVLGASARHSMPRPEVSSAYDSLSATRANTVPSNFDGLIFSFIYYSQLPKNLSIKRDEFWHIYSNFYSGIINEGAKV